MKSHHRVSLKHEMRQVPANGAANGLSLHQETKLSITDVKPVPKAAFMDY